MSITSEYMQSNDVKQLTIEVDKDIIGFDITESVENIKSEIRKGNLTWTGISRTLAEIVTYNRNDEFSYTNAKRLLEHIAPWIKKNRKKYPRFGL